MRRSPPVIMAMVAGLLLAGCGRSEPEQVARGTPPPFETLEARPETAQAEQVWDGVVEAINQATVSAQTSGRVVELPYDVNDTVPEGAVIVRFTDVEQKSAKSRAQAQIASAQAAYDEAQASYKRIAEVYARQLVAKAQLDQEQARRDAAKAALEAARAQLREVGQQMDYTVVRAPYSGIVTERYVQIGESVQPGQPLMSGVSLSDLRVSVQIPQSAIGPIRAQQSADILLDGNGGRRARASKVTVFPYADPATHTFTVRLELPGDDTGLYPGMTVKAAFATGAVERLSVPVGALVERGELIGLYIVDGARVSLRQVRIGQRHDDRVEVLAGLAGGERYATDPAAAAHWLSAQRHADAAQ
ncbi:efflux RND transporter periplasmic adaptor subunit [Dokdonella immobilis]|uniref:RND family efflux transporter, MFP subunit n=1 Tax=Dokdonella immobilis TaxID=578942 RepID=A0A1I5AIF3_9GAMM|nr:efflux RND transporter periplasmic adaptor subunit [Dokdonella immobilis]SFN62254.1 RND family efflux transporter, MFP subunit [Dokdonella immobilis]